VEERAAQHQASLHVEPDRERVPTPVVIATGRRASQRTDER
jgi:hypothetical protein